jgi:hypothetical protein
VVTFDVIPEQKEAAPDGTAGAGQAAQLLVTLENGEGTVSFGLGFASARGRTILNEFNLPGAGTTKPPLREVRTIPGPQTPLRYGSNSPTAADFVNSVGSSLGYRAPGRSNATTGRNPGGLPSSSGSGGLPTTGLDLLPPLFPNQAQGQNAGDTEAYGGDGPWLALIGGSVIGLALARYLAYSMAVRPTAA